MSFKITDKLDNASFQLIFYQSISGHLLGGAARVQRDLHVVQRQLRRTHHRHHVDGASGNPAILMALIMVFPLVCALEVVMHQLRMCCLSQD